MRYIKPQAISLASHPMMTADGVNLTITCLAGITMRGDFPELSSDQKIWKSLKGVLPGKITPDLCFPKPKAEWLAFGRAYPQSPEDMAASTSITIKRAGQIISEKSLYISGDRHWINMAGAGLPSEPKPLGGPLLLDWKFAYGGKGHPVNPSGIGYHSDGWAGKPLPKIEYRNDLISSPMGQPFPAGYAPLPLNGSDRFKLQGKYDQEWRKNVFPGFSASASPDLMMMGPEDQRIEGCFMAGDVITCKGMSPHKAVLQWTIPEWQARCFISMRGQVNQLIPITMKLDSLWLIPHVGVLGMMWRGNILISEFDAHDVSLILGALDDLKSSRPIHFYQEQVEIRSGFAKDSALMILDETALLPLGQNGFIFPAIPPDVKKRIQSALDQAKQKTDQAKPLLKDVPQTTAKSPPTPPGQEASTPEYIVALSKELGEIAVSSKPNVARFYEITKQLQAFGHADRKAQLQKIQQQSEAPTVQTPKPLNAGPPTRQNSALLAELKKAKVSKAAGTSISSENVDQSLQKILPIAVDSYRKSAHLQTLAAPLLAPEALATAIDDHLQLKDQKAQNRDWLGAILDEKKLDGCDFAGAFLDGASFKGCSLVGANFEGATLSSADFTGANLTSANLKGANLGKAIFTETDLTGATLDGAIMDMTTFVNTKLIGASLKKTSFLRSSLISADFTGANLTSAKFLGIKVGMDAVALLQKPQINPKDFIDPIAFDGLNFTGANLTMATLLGCEVKRGGQFKGANLSKSTLIKCKFNYSEFSAANFEGTKVALGAQLLRCNFEGANFKGAFFRGVNLSHSNFNFSNLNSGHFSLANMMGISAAKISAINARFERTKLVQATFIASNLIGASFRNSDLIGANFDDSKMTHCDLSTIITDNKTSFINADLSRALLPKQHIKR
jgi:uncharacterized protein YjbI with pentapeptide repeats